MEMETTTDLSEYLAAIRRRARLAAVVSLPIAITAAIFAVALPDVYRSTALFRLEDYAAPDTARYVKNEYVEQYVYSLIEQILDAPEALERVAELDPYPDLGRDPGAIGGKLWGDVHVNMVTARVRDPDTGLTREINTGFVLEAVNSDPGKAQQVASVLADLMVSVSRKNRNERETEASRFLADQADEARAGIMQAESKLGDFKRKNLGQLPELVQANLTSMERAQGELNTVEQQLAALRQNRSYYSQQLTQLQEAGPDAAQRQALQEEYNRKAAIYSPDHPDVIALRRQLQGLATGASGSGTGTLQGQLDDQRAILTETRKRYSDSHPDVRRLQRNVAALEARIAAGERSVPAGGEMRPAYLQVQGQLEAAQSQISALEVRRSGLQDSVRSLDDRIRSTPLVEQEYHKLTRDLDGARKLYEGLIEQKMEADLRAAAAIRGRGDEYRLVAMPEKPKEPAEPARLAIAAMGLIIAGFVALMTAMAAEAVDPSVRSSRDLQVATNNPPIAVIPEITNSVSRRRQRRQLAIAAASLVVGIPGLYILVRFVAG